jgi:hypothetical protein
MSATLDEQALQEAFVSIDALSMAEYRQPIAEVAGAQDATDSAVRIGRLVGVLLKEPFATSTQREQPSSRTAAYRDWHLVNEQDFNALALAHEAQVAALDQIRAELADVDPRVAFFTTTYAFARDAQFERGFFGYFARAVRKYICGDRVVREHVADALRESSLDKRGVVFTPETIVASGGASLGVYLVQTVPLIGMVGAPAVAALVLIVYRLGVEGFCDWSAQLETNEEENH